jgi:SAM-dependent methyltransferase
MPKVLQADAALIAGADGSLRLPKTVRVVFRSADGAVGERDFLTHWIHSYPAKMFHRIPQTILDQLSAKKKLNILDPFCGSGTVLLESIIRGHHAVGIDVNPLARLISKVKVTPLEAEGLVKLSRTILGGAKKRKAKVMPHEVLDFWFKAESREALESLRNQILRVEQPSDREFFSVCLSSIVRRASFADPTIPPPVRLNPRRARLANNRYKRHLEAAQSINKQDVFDLFQLVAERNIMRMRSLTNIRGLGSAIICSDSSEAANTGLKDASVDLVITSPPYCGAQKYARSTRLEMLLLGHSRDAISDVDRKTLGTERVSRKVRFEPPGGLPGASRIFRMIDARNSVRANIFATYSSYIVRFAEELFRVLKPGGEAFVTFGADWVAGVRVDCSQLFARAATLNGLAHISTLIDSIPSRGMITARHTSAALIKDERVVWVRKI